MTDGVIDTVLAGVPASGFAVVVAAPTGVTGLGTAVVVFVVACTAAFAGGTWLADAGFTADADFAVDAGFAAARGRFAAGAAGLAGVTTAGVEPFSVGKPQLAGGGSGDLGATSGGRAVAGAV